jgi:hypothetical protein
MRPDQDARLAEAVIRYEERCARCDLLYAAAVLTLEQAFIRIARTRSHPDSPPRWVPRPRLRLLPPPQDC